MGKNRHQEAYKAVSLYYEIMGYRDSSLDLLSHNCSVKVISDPSQDTLELLCDVEILFAPVGYLTDRVKIDNCPQLKVIASNTTGHPHIDVDYARKKGIKIVTLKNEDLFLSTITPTAELTWGLIVMITRNILPAYCSVIEGTWNRRLFGGVKMLSRMSLGVVGCGRLGKMVAGYGAAFGMDVGYFDPHVNVNSRFSRYDSLEQLVENSDVVTIHVPHEKSTENLFDNAMFSHFRPGAYLINTSRGELVDQKALLEHLESGSLGGAALDVFEDEFDPKFDIGASPLWRYATLNNNLVLTPHIGGSTEDAWSETEKFTIAKAIEQLG